MELGFVRISFRYVDCLEGRDNGDGMPEIDKGRMQIVQAKRSAPAVPQYINPWNECKFHCTAPDSFAMNSV